MSPARAKARPTCPACGSVRAAEIVYGAAPRTPELEAGLKRGEVVLGGCDIDDGDPLWECQRCRVRFGGKGAPWLPARS